MVLTMVVIAALLAGGAVLTSVQLSSTRSTTTIRETNAGLYCAEAGLAAARAAVVANVPWGGSLGSGAEPAWLAGVNHDIDGDGKPDFAITLNDNDDDADPSTDADQTVYIVSTCLKFPDAATQVTELVNVSGSPERRLWLRTQ